MTIQELKAATAAAKTAKNQAQALKATPETQDSVLSIRREAVHKWLQLQDKLHTAEALQAKGNLQPIDKALFAIAMHTMDTFPEKGGQHHWGRREIGTFITHIVNNYNITPKD